MGTSNHWEDCYLNEGHPLCRLLKIHDLQKEVQRLTTQLQYERTGHLTEQDPLVDYINDALVKMAETSKTCFGVPCGDVTPKIATHSVVLPTDARFTHHGEEPPSATP